MNHIYRVIFNQETGTFQAVSEIVRTSRKSHSSKGGHLPKILLTPLSVAVTLLSSQAFASPTGGQVTAGVANIAQTGTITNINQSSQNAAINWQSFNVGKNETVNFNQPNAQSVTLNRVIGNEKSVIDGAMNASGKVFISNANGMLIGKDAKINVGSLVATTANISDDDLMNGRYQFTGERAGSIENLGYISVPKGGVVALVAPIVKNGGTITAHEGNVLLASAESFSITLPDNANFAYTLDKGTLQGLVDNGGAILADAGRVVLTAKGVDTVKKSLIKHSGNIEANTVQNKNGVIELLGDLDNSALNVSGSLKAEGKESGDGGFIETSASQVRIEDNAEVSTLAENGETGTWLIDPNDIIIANSAGVKPDGTPYTKDEVTANGLTIANQLTKSNVTIQSTKGKSEGKGDVIIDDEIVGGNPHTNPVHTLKLNAYNDIHINKNIDLKGAVKLALEYGGNNSSESDVRFNNKSRINLPEGKTLSVQKGSSEKYELLVIHSLPNGQDFLNKDIAIGKDIDMSGINRSNGWHFPKNHNSYYGSLWGLGHNIDNLTITGTNEVGLVSKLDGGVIRDLNLNNVNITGNENVGGIIGKAYSHGTPTKIQNIDISGSISGGKSIGGIIGNAELRGTGGGLYGTDGTIDIEKINTNLTVKGSNDIGGVVGYSNLQGVGAGGAVLDINKVNTNNSQILGNENVGGIIGSADIATGNEGIARLEIYKTAVNGNIYGKNNNTGGFIGSSSTSSGIYGWSDIFFRDNYSNANIQGKTNIGGLIGKLKTNSGIAEVDRVYFTTQAKGDSNVDMGIGLTELINSSNFEIKFKDSFFDKTKIPQSDKNGLKGKTTKEMQQKSTFTDAGWDFDTVWRIQEGSDYPRLRALTEGKIVVNPTNIGIKANDLNKVYDGKEIKDQSDLEQLNGWNGTGVTVLDKDGKTVNIDLNDSSIFTGKLRFDGEGSNWKGAVNAGTYTIVPTGLSGGQKYEIEYGNGILTIDKKPVTIQLTGSRTYDGTTTVNGSEVTKVDGIVDSDKFEIEILGTAEMESKNAGSNKLVSHNFRIDDEFAKNYTPSFDLKNSVWTIKPKLIKVIGEREYDGTNQALASTLTFNSNDIIQGDHILPFDIYSSVKLNSKNSSNKPVKILSVSNSVGNDNIFNGNSSANYRVDLENSEFYIKPKKISLNASKTFDGNAIFKQGFALNEDEIIKGDKVQIIRGEGIVSSPVEGTYSKFISGVFELDNQNYTYDLDKVHAEIKFLKNNDELPIYLDVTKEGELARHGLNEDMYRIKYDVNNSIRHYSEHELEKMSLDELDEIIKVRKNHKILHPLPQDRIEFYVNENGRVSEYIYRRIRDESDLTRGLYGDGMVLNSINSLQSKEGFVFVSKLGLILADTIGSLATGDNLNIVLKKMNEMSEHPAYDAIKRLANGGVDYIGGSYSGDNFANDYGFGIANITLEASGASDLKNMSSIIEATSKILDYYEKNPDSRISSEDALELSTFITDIGSTLLSDSNFANKALNKNAGVVGGFLKIINSSIEAGKVGAAYGDYVGSKTFDAIQNEEQRLKDDLKRREYIELITYNQNTGRYFTQK